MTVRRLMLTIAVNSLRAGNYLLPVVNLFFPVTIPYGAYAGSVKQFVRRCDAAGLREAVCLGIDDAKVTHMELLPNLTNRIALVTGGSRGIGRSIALALAQAGAGVAVNYHERAVEADAVVAAIRATGRHAHAIGADVSDSDAVARMMARIEDVLGPVDVLVNNAGIAIIRGVDDVTEADFDLTLAVNLKSAFLCTQAVLPGMRARRWGRIVNISSGAARGAGGIGVHYNASKAGMEGLTRGYAARLVKEGITVNAVAPSLIDTDMMNTRRDQYVARIPLGRMGTADEVAQAVLMVIGNEYMTGQTVQLNGGTNFI
jgi:3-oxoacyl-[acyl-carrier protein] reductase